MEHRYSPRMTLNLKAILHVPGRPPQVCKVTNIGSDGAYVQACGLERARHVLVDIALPAGSGREQRRVQAMVVHVGPAGAGLMFLSPCEDLPALAVRVSGTAAGRPCSGQAVPERRAAGTPERRTRMP